MTTFYAQPYSLEHTGFYFDSLEQYETGMQQLEERGCEEVEIQFIDGEGHLAALAKATDIGQGDVALWFEVLEDLDETAAIQMSFLLEDIGYGLSEALERYDEVCLYEGQASDFAYELYEASYDIPEHLRLYIDYEAIARDMKINGDITELRHDLLVTNASDF